MLFKLARSVMQCRGFFFFFLFLYIGPASKLDRVARCDLIWRMITSSLRSWSRSIEIETLLASTGVSGECRDASVKLKLRVAQLCVSIKAEAFDSHSRWNWASSAAWKSHPFGCWPLELTGGEMLATRVFTDDEKAFCVNSVCSSPHMIGSEPCNVWFNMCKQGKEPDALHGPLFLSSYALLFAHKAIEGVELLGLLHKNPCVQIVSSRSFTTARWAQSSFLRCFIEIWQGKK